MLDNFYLERVLMPWSITKAITSIDKLSQISITSTRQPVAFIVNTSPFPLPGHWIALIFTNDFHCIFFDPLGPTLPHQPEEISVFIQKNSLSVEFNLNQIQNFSSDFCGFFCIAKIISFMSNESHSTFSSYFSHQNTALNDTLVVKHILSLALNL